MTHYILLIGALVMFVIGILNAVSGRFDVMASAFFLTIALFLIFKFGPRPPSKTPKGQPEKGFDSN